MDLNTVQTSDDYYNLLSKETLAQSARSLYLSFKLLPAQSRPSISLFYLLGRAFDNIADTKEIPAELRLHSLRNLMKILEKEAPIAEADVWIKPLLPFITNPRDKDLILKIPFFFKWLFLLPNEDRQDVVAVMRLIMAGDEIDLNLFANPKHIQSLKSDEELLEYCYFQASGIAEIATRMLSRQVKNFSYLDEAQMIFLANQFATGMQYINILRDIPADLNDGRCYIPLPLLHSVGLTPETILSEPEKLIPLLNDLHQKTLNYFDQWLEYNLAIRGRKTRYSMTIALLISMNTLILLKDPSYIKNQKRVKLSRKQIKKIVMISLLAFLPKKWLRSYYFKLRQLAVQAVK